MGLEGDGLEVRPSDAVLLALGDDTVLGRGAEHGLGLDGMRAARDHGSYIGGGITECGGGDSNHLPPGQPAL